MRETIDEMRDRLTVEFRQLSREILVMEEKYDELKKAQPTHDKNEEDLMREKKEMRSEISAKKKRQRQLFKMEWIKEATVV
mgnify:CR=1 FL=1